MNRNYMGIAFYFGTLNIVEVKHSLKLFADEVMAITSSANSFNECLTSTILSVPK
ncbi:MAG: hypothetical protein WCH96_08260 [Betaproteobacteria bacterium]